VRTKIDGKGWDCFPSDEAQGSRAVSTGHRHDDLYQQIAQAKCLLGQIQLFSKDAEYLVKFPCFFGKIVSSFGDKLFSLEALSLLIVMMYLIAIPM